jgi:uncharacterized protein (TIGR04255 family)
MFPVLDPDRPIYPNAPLKLVACEIAYTLAPGGAIGAARDAVYESVADAYPLPGAPPQQITVQMGPAGAMTHQSAEGFRFLNRERTRSLVATSESLIVETSAYHRFEEFEDRITQAITVLGSHVRIAAAHRIGVRYIDEIPLTDLPDHTFEDYFIDSVLAPGKDVPDVGEPVEFMTTSRFTFEGDRNTVMRTGVLQTPVVNPDGPLTIGEPSSAPLLLIDIDSSWQALTTPPLPFEAGPISEVLYSLHAPVRALFEHSITEKLRTDVLRKEIAP